jgi:nucleotide-binding universal stress UspA family protein
MKVIVAYDGSTYADAAVNDLARAGLPRNTDVLIATVADFSVVRPAVSEFDMISAASRRVDTLVDAVRHREVQVLKGVRSMTSGIVHRLRRQYPGWRVNSEILTGEPSEELLRLADRWDADLIIAGSHGRSAIGRFFLGSVSKSLSEKAASSVRVVRGGTGKIEGDPIEIILGVRNPAEAERLVETVGRRVWPAGMRIRLVAVDDGVSAGRVSAFYPDGKTIYETAAEQLADICLDVTVQLESGDAATVFLEAANAWRADAIFVSAGQANDGGGLDETASALITTAKCTVEIVR